MHDARTIAAATQFRGLALVALTGTLLQCGCQGIADVPLWSFPSPPAANPAIPAQGAIAPGGLLLPNPAQFPVTDREFFWTQLVDTVDDYFLIRSEQRVQLIGSVATEGLIETQPKAGATFFEPWQLDSTPGYEKWLATLQSIRRRATVRVVPSGRSYMVHVVVEKALEDVTSPAQATPGSTLPRQDNSLMRLSDAEARQSQTLGWISLGRDITLEQEILRELTARVFDSG